MTYSDFAKKITLTVYLMVMPLILFPQAAPSFQSVDQIKFRVPYQHHGAGKYMNGNTVLREMAKVVLKEPWQVRVEVKFDLTLEIRRGGLSDTLLINIGKVSIQGDTVYRQFGIADVLCPSQINLQLKWAYKADTTAFSEQMLPGFPFQNIDKQVSAMAVPIFDHETDTLMVSGLELSYDSFALNSFINRLQLIHNYHASLTVIDSLKLLAGAIHLDNPATLPRDYFMVVEFNKAMEQIDLFDFPETLLAGGFDPGGLMQGYRESYRNGRTLTFNFLDRLRAAGNIPWDGRCDILADYFTERVVSYIRRSQLMDNLQGTIYRDWLEHFFDIPPFPEQDDITDVLLRKMYPDASPDTLKTYFDDMLCKSMEITSMELISHNRHADAFSLLEFSRLLEAHSPVLKNRLHKENLQQKAAEGIYNSYVEIAAGCLKSARYTMADTYLTKADQYARSNPTWVKDHSVYKRVFSELFFLRNGDCDQMLDQKKYAEALECYNQFEQDYTPRDLALVREQLDKKKSKASGGLGKIAALLAEDALRRNASDTALFFYRKASTLRKVSGLHEQVDVSLDSLAPFMAGIRYRQIFNEGTVALEKRQFTLAVSKFREAKALAVKYVVPPAQEFDSVYRRANKHMLIIQLSTSQKMIWANQFDSAKAALKRTEDAGFDFGLMNDPDFIASIDRFKTRILEQRCMNLQDSVNLRMIRADLSHARHNFINMEVYLEQALKFAGSMPECGILVRPMMDTIARYQEAARFQQGQADAHAIVASGNYAEALLRLSEIIQSYSTNKLVRFGLQQEDIIEFVRGSNNPYFAEKAATFYLEKEKPGEALQLCLIARDQGLPESSGLLLQQNLGVQLAKIHFRDHPEEDPDIILPELVPGNDWFDEFRSSYTRTWKKLASGSHGK